MSYLVHSKFEIGAYHLNSLLLSYQKSFKLDHQTSTYIYLYLCLLLKSELSFMMYVHVHTPLPLTGHSRVYSVLVGTNQGSVLGYSVDMPSGRHRDSRSPIIMPIGDYRSHQGGHMHACTCSCLNLIGRLWIVGNMCMYMYENKSGSLYDNSSRSSYHTFVSTRIRIRMFLPDTHMHFYVPTLFFTNPNIHFFVTIYPYL